ncbi:putative bifunctional diguanylate cyclase/phosphodiesterase [Maricaulis sp. CAU 1757]
MNWTANPRRTDDTCAKASGPGDQQELLIAYRPIVRGASIAALFYFGMEVVKRLVFASGIEQLILLGSAVTALLLTGCVMLSVRRFTTALPLELSAGLICLCFVGNANVNMAVTYQTENLVYYVLMMPVFACMLPSLRMIAFTVSLCVASLLYFVQANAPSELGDYISVTISGIVAAGGIAFLIRGAVLAAVRARIEAVNERRTAVDMARQAQSLAERDVLTGLANRRSFFQHFEQLHQKTQEGRAPFLLALVDLDGFKPINDTYGHAAGDTVLQVVAKRLESLPVEHIFAARLGGDEFAILAPASGLASESARELGRLASKALHEPYDLSECTIPASGSVGIIVCENGERSQHELMERADHALYVAKRTRRGEAVVFNDALEAEMLSNGQIDRAFRKADLESELDINFQPQFDLQREKVCGFETLARWNSPSLGIVSPSIFIPAAERTGRIRELTRFLLEKALATQADWPDDLRLSFNLSTQDLMSPEAVTGILRVVQDSGIEPSRIEFEITESAMMGDFDQACASVGRLADAGCSLALDDFGIGHSNFNYLHRLPVNKIKIDRSFLVRLVEDNSAVKIVRTLIGLSHTLDLDCVIEGVETQGQLELLRSFGARFIQGYLIGAPVGTDSVAQTLARVDNHNPARLVPPSERRRFRRTDLKAG